MNLDELSQWLCHDVNIINSYKICRQLPATPAALLTTAIATAKADDDGDEKNSTNDTDSNHQSLKVHYNHRQ